jgi:hypothetical protein
VFRIQLTWTNAVFSRIILVSRFCAKIQLSGKFPENIAKLLFYQKTHGARRRDRDEPRGAHTTRWRGPGRARGCCGRFGHRLEPSFHLHKVLDLKIEGVRHFSQIEFCCAATTRNLDSESETPFWHPAGTGNWRRSSPSSSPTPLHQPSIIPPSMCE